MKQQINEIKRMRQLAGILTEVKVKTNKATDLQFILRDLGDAYGEQIADDLTKDEFKNYTVGQIIDDWKKLKKGLNEDESSSGIKPGDLVQLAKGHSDKRFHYKVSSIGNDGYADVEIQTGNDKGGVQKFPVKDLILFRN